MIDNVLCRKVPEASVTRRAGSKEVMEQLSPGEKDAVGQNATPSLCPEVVLSFDVEQHFRIEAAAGLTFSAAAVDYYSARVAPSTHWLLEQLARFELRATFFVVGEI